MSNHYHLPLETPGSQPGEGNGRSAEGRISLKEELRGETKSDWRKSLLAQLVQSQTHHAP